MDDPAGMRGVEGIRNVHSDIQHQLVRHRAVADSMFQRLSFQELHHDELLALELADVVDCADVRMVEGGCSARLPLKSFDCVTVLQDRIQGGI